MPLSQEDLAAMADTSIARVRDITGGTQRRAKGERVQVSSTAETIAKLAYHVGLNPEAIVKACGFSSVEIAEGLRALRRHVEDIEAILDMRDLSPQQRYLVRAYAEGIRRSGDGPIPPPVFTAPN